LQILGCELHNNAIGGEASPDPITVIWGWGRGKAKERVGHSGDRVRGDKKLIRR